MLFLVTSLLTLFSILSFTSAQKSSNNDSSAVFVYEGDLNTQLVFALNADKSTGDLYFHLESPAGNSWVGVGIGEEMKGSLMLIAYPNGDNGVTISPRVADGHSEPVAQGDITISKLGTNAITGSGRNKKIVVDGVCRKCTSWKYGGSIDLSSKAQPFIFAVGPSFPATQSGNTDASLSRHEFYGDFTMDMTAATSSSGGSVPLGPYVTKDASQATDTKLDRDPAPHIHGLVMSIVFILLLPLSSLLLRVWHKVKGHMWVNIVATVLFFMAFAGGIVISQQYNKSKHFNSAHQVIGILILLAFIAQLTLGILHHRIYKREQRKTIMSKIHLGLGPAIIFFGLINGGIGFSFAGKLSLSKVTYYSCSNSDFCNRYGHPRSTLRDRHSALRCHLPVHPRRYLVCPKASKQA